MTVRSVRTTGLGTSEPKEGARIESYRVAVALTRSGDLA